MIVSRTTRSDREQLLASRHLPLGEGEGKGDVDDDGGTDRLFKFIINLIIIRVLE